MSKAFDKISAALEDAIAFAKGDTSRGRIVKRTNAKAVPAQRGPKDAPKGASMNPLDRLTEVISRLMGKEPSDPDVLEAVVEVVMAMREPSVAMARAIRHSRDRRAGPADIWKDGIDALLTEGEG